MRGDYDELKLELKTIEAEMKESVADLKPFKPIEQAKKEHTDMTEMKAFLKQVKSTIDQFERKQETPKYYIYITEYHLV
ncbi:hypothetical protein DPMN_125464 [Dreissena polymorpha]|uniref:Uncharacterized protein n=1 Tax=Dreissena polymorpha TaxID=45954 RepID=A0A9D4JX75_DREPO|nr:hypothetical protein DPMN_125464 [Dreissena polymorpha]